MGEPVQDILDLVKSPPTFMNRVWNFEVLPTDLRFILTVKARVECRILIDKMADPFAIVGRWVF